MPQSFIVKRILSIVEGLPRFPDLKILDLSCGEGEILSALHAKGCTVQGTHYREDDYILRTRHRLKNLKITPGVNLHCTLPFPDGSFDLLIASEVIEHLGTHLTLISEAGRVLKPGGHFILTSPNIHRLHSRVQFFLTGTHKLVRRRAGWDLAPDDLYAYHIHPVDFPLLHTLLHQAGLSIVSLHFTLFKLRHAYWFALYPLLMLACWINQERHRKSPRSFHEGERDLRRWLTHPALLGSEQLCLLSRRFKPLADEPPRPETNGSIVSASPVQPPVP